LVLSAPYLVGYHRATWYLCNMQFHYHNAISLSQYHCGRFWAAVEPLKAVCVKAPFGRGTETLYDETVRRAWQVDASQITLGGEEWDDHLQLVVVKACYELGFSGERIENLDVHANLYKLLLYETGGHFTPHRDIEKENGMFGTLVVQLPCKFTGGSLTVNHNGESKTFELSDKCEDTMKYIAFYADCEHQLHSTLSRCRPRWTILQWACHQLRIPTT
jgi:2OG-Fe(II) oxygenase superfamily